MALLHTSITIRGKRIKNRIVVPPMADFGATGEDGRVNERHLRHYGAFAEGGAGLIFIEACAVSKMDEPRATLGLYSDDALPGFTRLARAAKAGGAVSMVQLLHSGLSIMPERTIADISYAKLIQYKTDFVHAAYRCRHAGFDGVELHAAHGFFLNQIIETSARTDEYGGAFQNRIRMLTELITEVKVACGGDFLVAVRFGTPNLQELILIAKTIETAGGDLLDVSTGSGGYRNLPPFPYDPKIYAASRVRATGRLPVIGVGGIETGAQAEQILEHGYADMTAIGRGHLCNPRWAQKTAAGEKPNPCRHCRPCRWYVDGLQCPGRKADR